MLRGHTSGRCAVLEPSDLPAAQPHEARPLDHRQQLDSGPRGSPSPSPQGTSPLECVPWSRLVQGPQVLCRSVLRGLICEWRCGNSASLSDKFIVCGCTCWLRNSSGCLVTGIGCRLPNPRAAPQTRWPLGVAAGAPDDTEQTWESRSEGQRRPALPKPSPSEGAAGAHTQLGVWSRSAGREGRGSYSRLVVEWAHPPGTDRHRWTTPTGQGARPSPVTLPDAGPLLFPQ